MNGSFQEMDARGTGVYLDPDYTDKFHSPDYNYLGICPPSPKFLRRTSSPRSPIRQTAPADLAAPGANCSGPANPGAASSSQSGQAPSSLYEQRLTQLMGRVSAAVERNESRLEEQDRREAIALEWKQVSLVCDR